MAAETHALSDDQTGPAGNDARRRERLILVGAAAAILALFLVASMWSIGAIEEDLARSARQELRADGIDVSGLTIAVDGRSLEVSGEVDSVAKAFRIDELLQGQHGIRDADTAGIRVPAPAAATAALLIDVTVSVSDAPRLVDLVGSVPDQKQLQRIVAAAVAAYGSDAVSDRLELVDGSSSGDIERRVSGLGAAIRALAAPGVRQGTATLTGGQLSVVALVDDAAAREALAAAAAGATVDITVLDVEAGLVRMDFEVDGGLIRLNDTVLTEQQRDELILAAAAASGVAVDELPADIEVSGLAEAIPGSDARISAVASLFAPLADAERVLRATGSLHGADLRVRAIVTGQGVADDLTALIDAAGGTATITVDEPTTPGDEVSALNGQFVSLNERLQQVTAFETSSAQLTDAAAAILDDAVQALRGFPDPAITVSGHSSNTGGADFNLALSQQRAEAVVAYLLFNGIDAARLTADGRGITDMLDDRTVLATDPRQQRVEFEAFSP